MTYWDVNDVEVDNIMTEFLKKSLAKCDFDEGLATYVYSIHILFLDYLKTGLTKDEEMVGCTENMGNRIKHNLYFFCSVEVPQRPVGQVFGEMLRRLRRH